MKTSRPRTGTPGAARPAFPQTTLRFVLDPRSGLLHVERFPSSGRTRTATVAAQKAQRASGSLPAPPSFPR